MMGHIWVGTYLALIRLIEWQDMFGPNYLYSVLGHIWVRDIFGPNYLYSVLGHIWVRDIIGPNYLN